MIKCEVVFNGGFMIVNNHRIEFDFQEGEFVCWDGVTWYTIEEAVKYCMEH